MVDFGLATTNDVDEYLFKRCGTPGYVAPEVINAPKGTNVRYSTKCDMFGAGVIFYALLVKELPFDAESVSEIIRLNKKCSIDFKMSAM